jgi:cysteine desulfurase
MIYLDAAATAPVRREVLEAMWPYLTGEFGNPSSSHALGHRAADALKQARATVAACLGCRASEIIFTSGGTEADNLAIKGLALAQPRGSHIVTTPIEHEAVLESCSYLQRQHSFALTHVPVDHVGSVDPAHFAAALHDDTTLASVMLANNEVGTIQPIAELARLAHARGALFHTDAVQAAGVLGLDVAKLGVDALSLSGHKLGAPKGVGALFVRGRLQLEPVLHGGGQERGRRSGTENVAGAVGLAKALELAASGRAERSARLSAMRDALIYGEVPCLSEGILAAVPGAILTGPQRSPEGPDRLPGNASFCFPGTSGEAILLELESCGILCSSGSACAAGRDEPSHVLLAMGFTPELAQTAVRFTLSDAVTDAMLPEIVAAVQAACRAVRGV